MYLKTEHKNKKTLLYVMLSKFNYERNFNNHKARCLLINDTQAVKYETGIINFKNYEKKNTNNI